MPQLLGPFSVTVSTHRIHGAGMYGNIYGVYIYIYISW